MKNQPGYEIWLIQGKVERDKRRPRVPNDDGPLQVQSADNPCEVRASRSGVHSTDVSRSDNPKPGRSRATTRWRLGKQFDQATRKRVFYHRAVTMQNHHRRLRFPYRRGVPSRLQSEEASARGR